MRVFTVAALLLLILSCSSGPKILDGTALAAGQEVLQVAAFDYLVGPGDVLRVNVFRHPELGSGPYHSNTPGSPVEGSGFIALPLLGRVEVNGTTVFQIQEEVTLRLREYLKDPKVDVSMVEFGSRRIFVFGEVNLPGMLVLERPMSALEALAQSGGFTLGANRKQVALIRGPLAEENLTLFNAEALDPLASTSLQPGDILFVSRRRWASISQAAADLVPLLQVISLPISTVRDVAIFQDIRNN